MSPPPFNEAAAVKPRKTRWLSVGSDLCLLPFNEAAAVKPRKTNSGPARAARYLQLQ